MSPAWESLYSEIPCLGGGGVCTMEVQCIMSNGHMRPLPPVDGMMGRQKWKHCLPATLLTSGKNDTKFVNITEYFVFTLWRNLSCFCGTVSILWYFLAPQLYSWFFNHFGDQFVSFVFNFLCHQRPHRTVHIMVKARIIVASVAVGKHTPATVHIITDHFNKEYTRVKIASI